MTLLYIYLIFIIIVRYTTNFFNVNYVINTKDFIFHFFIIYCVEEILLRSDTIVQTSIEILI
jgi:hypothetical protein